MLSTVFHPNYLFINKESLHNEFMDFAKNLNEFVTAVNDIEEAKIYWSPYLISNFNTEAPWSEKYAKILNKESRFRQYVVYMRKISFRLFQGENPKCSVVDEEELSRFDACESEPKLTFFIHEILEETKKIISYSAAKGKTSFVVKQNNNYRFFLNRKKLDINVISSPEDLYDYESYESMWPKSSKEKSKFDDCINLYKRRYKKEFLYKAIYTKKFVDSFITEENKGKKNKIINRMAMRLSMTQSEAEKSLNDHSFKNKRKGGRKEYRINVDAAARINYLFNSEGEIEFNLYTPGGKHDELL